jgi:hypothetical protein
MVQLNEGPVLIILAACAELMPYSASSGWMEVFRGPVDPGQNVDRREMETFPLGLGLKQARRGFEKKEPESPSPDGVPSLGNRGQMGHRFARNLVGFTTSLRFFTSFAGLERTVTWRRVSESESSRKAANIEYGNRSIQMG